MVDSALRSSKRMSRLVGDLLLLARADAGRAGKHAPCDLAEIAGNAAVELAPLMGDRELDIDNQHALPVDGQSPTSCTAWSSTCSTTPPATRHPAPASNSDVRRVGDDGVVEVADDGPGIPPRLREQIFDRFVRGEGPADTAVGPGSGLGLAIVRAVATSHGGTVEGGESAAGGALFASACRCKPEPSAAGFSSPLAARPSFSRGRDTGPAGSPQQPPAGPFFAQTSTTTGRTIGRRRSFS